MVSDIRGVDERLLPALRKQLPGSEAHLLGEVLGDLAARARDALGGDFIGAHLKGSFTLGSGDIYADVDFLVVTKIPISGPREQVVREYHQRFPDRKAHRAHVLEGSYAPITDLRERADPKRAWLYFDNGQREMEWSAHDNTEVFRWVLKNRALTIIGPAPGSLFDSPPVQALRDEAAALAVRRREAALADPEYLENGWGQPHEVLTHCRMLYTASTGKVAGKGLPPVWLTLGVDGSQAASAVA